LDQVATLKDERGKKAFAEFLGMFLFVWVGAGTAMSVGASNGAYHIALAFGIGIFVLASAIGHHSGGQMNCAVTFALCLTGDCAWIQGLMNFVAQMLGSTFAGLVLAGTFPGPMDQTGGFATNSYAPGVEWCAIYTRFRM